MSIILPPSAAALPEAAKTVKPGWRPLEMHPYPRLRRYFPRWGKSALHLPLVSYVMNNISVISRLRRLLPLWCLTAPPSPPAERWDYNPPRSNHFISISRRRSAKTSPSGGGAAKDGRRGAFRRAKGAVVRFFRPKGGLPVFPGRKPGCKGFLKTGAAGAHHNPHGLKGRVKPENPQVAGPSNLACAASVNPHAR